MLQSLNAFCQIFVVEFGLIVRAVFLNQSLGTHDVKSSNFFNQIHGQWICFQVLLRDIFTNGSSRAPKIFEPLTDIFKLQVLKAVVTLVRRMGVVTAGHHIGVPLLHPAQVHFDSVNGIAKEMIHGCLEDVRGTKFMEVCNLLISRRSGVFLDGSFVINFTRGTFFVWSQLVFTCSGVPKNRNLGLL